MNESASRGAETNRPLSKFKLAEANVYLKNGLVWHNPNIYVHHIMGVLKFCVYFFLKNVVIFLYYPVIQASSRCISRRRTA